MTFMPKRKCFNNYILNNLPNIEIRINSKLLTFNYCNPKFNFLYFYES